MIELLTVGRLATNCYLVYDAPGGAALVVDPGAEPERIRTRLVELGLRLGFILLTHGHGDHVGGAAELQDWSGAPVALSERDRPILEDVESYSSLAGEGYRVPERLAFLNEGQQLSSGGIHLVVWELPGHTPGSLGFLGPGFTLSGDTLFAGSVGRTDFTGGDPAALGRSLERLRILPAETKVYPGHGGFTSLGREWQSNPFLR